MFRGGSLTLFRFRGVPVRAHWTLLLLLPYLAVVYATGSPLVAEAVDLDPAELVLPPIVWGLLVAVALFASVAVHELVHTLLALRAGGRVREVTLMLLGGVSQIEHMPSRPRNEVVIAGAGPLASLALAAGLYLLSRLALPADLRLGLFYVAQLNLLLGVFNLLPAFPMDGGRVLRGLLAIRLGRARATRIAATAGKAMAVLFALLALYVGNFLLLFIALFLFGGADAEARGEELREAFSGLRVSEIMAPPVAVSLADSLADAHAAMRRAARLELVVVDDRGAPVGVLRAADVVRVAEEDRPFVQVRRLAEALGRRGAVVGPDAPVQAALEAAAARGADTLLVVSGDQLVGVIGPAELQTAMALRPRRRGRRLEPRPT